jgi:hypothetical protein
MNRESAGPVLFLMPESISEILEGERQVNYVLTARIVSDMIIVL